MWLFSLPLSWVSSNMWMWGSKWWAKEKKVKKLSWLNLISSTAKDMHSYLEWHLHQKVTSLNIFCANLQSSTTVVGFVRLGSPSNQRRRLLAMQNGSWYSPCLMGHGYVDPMAGECLMWVSRRTNGWRELETLLQWRRSMSMQNSCNWRVRQLQELCIIISS